MTKLFQSIVILSISAAITLPTLAFERSGWGKQQSWFDSIATKQASSIYLAEEQVGGVESLNGRWSWESKQNNSPFFKDISPYTFAQSGSGESQVSNRVGMSAVEEEKQSPGGYTDEEIAEMINNPLGNLWLLFTQNDTVWYEGDILDRLDEDNKAFNTLLINPVMPFQLTEGWKYVFRPIIPINSFKLPKDVTIGRAGFPPTGSPDVNVDFERETGLGDIVLFNVFTTNEGAKPPNVIGAGITVMMDTASDDRLGTGKWSAGPAALAMRITEKWIYGGIFQHWWSFAGDSDRDDVNLTDLQYILRYRVTPETNIGFGPNIRINWDADSGEKLAFPVGLGGDTMIKIGPLPVKIGLEGYYYVEKPDNFGPEWQIRFLFVPIIPSPVWSKVPIFGK